jgi:hypothetical protein
MQSMSTRLKVNHETHCQRWRRTGTDAGDGPPLMRSPGRRQTPGWIKALQCENRELKADDGSVCSGVADQLDVPVVQEEER